jgi:hypothetical protein
MGKPLFVCPKTPLNTKPMDTTPKQAIAIMQAVQEFATETNMQMLLQDLDFMFHIALRSEFLDDTQTRVNTFRSYENMKELCEKIQIAIS